jgi:hypothetical protein
VKKEEEERGLDESKQADQAYACLIPGYSIWMRVKEHSPYLRLFKI